VVRLLEISSLEQRVDQTADVNCSPRSDVMHSGTPNLATHVAMKVSAQDVAEVSLSGTASNHLVDLSIMVKMWLKPPEETGTGPTRSTCTCVKRQHGIGMGCAGAAGCNVTLPGLQPWHSLHQAVISAAMPLQQNRAKMRRRVALVPGWTMVWMLLKTSQRYCSRTIGLMRPLDTSQRIWPVA
jgi:hypothetical protein